MWWGCHQEVKQDKSAGGRHPERAGQSRGAPCVARVGGTGIRGTRVSVPVPLAPRKGLLECSIHPFAGPFLPLCFTASAHCNAAACPPGSRTDAATDAIRCFVMILDSEELKQTHHFATRTNYLFTYWELNRDLLKENKHPQKIDNLPPRVRACPRCVPFRAHQGTSGQGSTRQR